VRKKISKITLGGFLNCASFFFPEKSGTGLTLVWQQFYKAVPKIFFFLLPAL
jgi:hypothetical protein